MPRANVDAQTVVECAHPEACHQHGTRAAYNHDHCRCAPCAAANTAYETQRRRRVAYGRSRLVDASPVRDHLHQLRQAGIGTRQIAALAGVGESAIIRVLYGRYADQPGHPEHRAPAARILRGTARRLLAVTPHAAPGSLVDATGTRRRLQALAASGWPWRDIARLVGVSPATVWQLITDRSARTTARTARTIAAAYTRYETTAGPSARARSAAARRGWLTPAWWDSDTIDDPTYHPDTNPRAGTLTPDDILDVALCLRRGTPPTTIAATLGLRPWRLVRELRDADRADLAATMTTQLRAATPRVRQRRDA